MTPLERRKPALLNAKRKKRVAKGSGTRVQDINRLLKQYKMMRKMMKGAQGKWLRRSMGGGGGALGGGGGIPGFPGGF
jgi:signal recognition particle subunit SRP54